MPTINDNEKSEFKNHISCEKSPLGEIISSSISYEIVTSLAEQESPNPSNEDMRLDEDTPPSSPVYEAKHNHVPSSRAAPSEKISNEPKHDSLDTAKGLNNQSEPTSSPAIKTVYALLGELKEHVNNTKLSLQASPIRSPLCAARVQLEQAERPVAVENLEPAKKETIHINSSIGNESINNNSSDELDNNEKETRQVASVEPLAPTGSTIDNQLPKFKVPPIITQQLTSVNKPIGAAMITPENKTYSIRSCTPPRYPRPAVDYRTKNASRVPVTPEVITLQSDEMDV